MRLRGVAAVRRYFRRFGLRAALWGVRFGCIAWGMIMFGWMLEREPNGWSLVAVIVCYGIYVLKDAAKAPVVVTQIKGNVVEIEGGKFVLDADHLDRAVDRLVERRMRGEEPAA